MKLMHNIKSQLGTAGTVHQASLRGSSALSSNRQQRSKGTDSEYKSIRSNGPVLRFHSVLHTSTVSLTHNH